MRGPVACLKVQAATESQPIAAGHCSRFFAASLGPITAIKQVIGSTTPNGIAPKRGNLFRLRNNPQRCHLPRCDFGSDMILPSLRIVPRNGYPVEQGCCPVGASGQKTAHLHLGGPVFLGRQPDKIAMIDMPIGLPDSGYRDCDLSARRTLGKAPHCGCTNELRKS